MLTICAAPPLPCLHRPCPYQVDVPYIGIVKSCDPREGLYVQFESYEDQEMLITNEVAFALTTCFLLTRVLTCVLTRCYALTCPAQDDWRWGSHSGGRKPPERSFQR